MAGSWLVIGGALAGAVAAAGCFSPSIPEGYACGTGDSCPPGQGCDIDGICRAEPSAVEPDAEPDEPDSGVVEVGHDEDGDGIDDARDNCPGLANANQRDERDDGDGVGDACDPNPDDPGDVILAFAAFAGEDELADWKVLSGSSTFIVVDDFLEQIDGGQGVSAIGLQSLMGSVGTIDVGAQLISSVVPFDSGFGAAVGLSQQGNAVSGYGCLRGGWQAEPRLHLVDIDRGDVDDFEWGWVDGAPADELTRYRLTASPRDNDGGSVDLDCEMLDVDSELFLDENREGERNGRFGVVTVDASARFAYVVVYGRTD